MEYRVTSLAICHIGFFTGWRFVIPHYEITGTTLAPRTAKLKAAKLFFSQFPVGMYEMAGKNVQSAYIHPVLLEQLIASNEYDISYNYDDDE
jgi:hypothetical protein